jgi:hypothetical protein
MRWNAVEVRVPKPAVDVRRRTFVPPTVRVLDFRSKIMFRSARFVSFAALTAAAVVGLSQESFAQSRGTMPGLGNTNGTAGFSSAFGGGGAGGGMGNAGFGGMGNAGFGGMGNAGFGGMGNTGFGGMGNAGFGGFGNSGFGGMGNAGTGANGQQGRFIGQTNTSGRFVGNAMAGQQRAAGMNGMNRQGSRNFGANNPFGDLGPFGMNGMNQFGGNQQGTGTNRRPIRPAQLVAFDFPAPTAPTMTTNISTRFTKLSRRADFANVEVSVTDGVATLRGEVSKLNDVRVAERLARLEPGVRSVNNEVTVREEESVDP